MSASDLQSRQLFLKKSELEYGHSTEQIQDNIDKAASFSDNMQPTKSAQFPYKERFLVCYSLPEMVLSSQTKFLESM